MSEERRTSEDPPAPAPDGGTVTAELVVQPAGQASALPWRQRAQAVRAGLPQLVRNPVVVGASAAVAGIAARVAVELAVDLARRATGVPVRPARLEVGGQVVHHVVHHHVVHHVVHQVAAPVVPVVVRTVALLPPPAARPR
ncbi:hypothetical protein [Kineococcus glutinatus]|uniref:Uncharacterized protein n=1 Tax=Kineococcus glutinatus TaxID=1070872 RepID=A0ABP9HYV6_9ACTN